MFIEDQDILNRELALGCTHRFAVYGGKVLAIVVDLSTGKEWCTYESDDHTKALVGALDKAEKTPPPMTKTQEARIGGLLEDKDKEIADLKARLATLQSGGSSSAKNKLASTPS